MSVKLWSATRYYNPLGCPPLLLTVLEGTIIPIKACYSSIMGDIPVI